MVVLSEDVRGVGVPKQDGRAGLEWSIAFLAKEARITLDLLRLKEGIQRLTGLPDAKQLPPLLEFFGFGAPLAIRTPDPVRLLFWLTYLTRGGPWLHWG